MSGFKIVMDRERCRADQADLLKTYQVVRDRSEDLQLPAVKGVEPRTGK